MSTNDSTDEPVDPYPFLPKGNDLFDRLLAGLRKEDLEFNTRCAVTLIRLQTEFGYDAATRLAREATAKGKHPDFRIRILHAIQFIGQPLSPDAFFDVFSLVSHPVEEVARKAAIVISALRPCNLPTTNNQRLREI